MRDIIKTLEISDEQYQGLEIYINTLQEELGVNTTDILLYAICDMLYWIETKGEQESVFDFLWYKVLIESGKASIESME